MKKISKGLLIVFEGIDGTGKSTQIDMAAKVLSSEHEVISTREPTDGVFGKKIRQLYADRGSVSREEELNLFLSDRREHVDTLINPSLVQGKIVLSDRYYFSTAAYQGATGQDPESIIKLNEDFAPVPDLVILIDLPPSESVRRIQSFRKEKLNDFEQEDALVKVSEVFNSIERPYIKRVDGTQKIADVHASIMVEINKLIQDNL